MRLNHSAYGLFNSILEFEISGIFQICLEIVFDFTLLNLTHTDKYLGFVIRTIQIKVISIFYDHETFFILNLN